MNSKFHIFNQACKQGDILTVAKVYSELTETEDNDLSEDLSDAVNLACLAGQLEVVRYLAAKIPNDPNLWIPSACESGNIDLVKLLLEKSARNYHQVVQFWNSALVQASRHTSDLVNLFLPKATDEAVEEAVEHARRNNRDDIVSLLEKELERRREFGDEL